MVYEMDRKTNSSKVSQITQLFQQNSQQITGTTIKPTTPEKPENFSKKFNSARAMFEKLGTSEEKEEKKVVTSAATVTKFKPALPEKPEKKLNGRELIEKQKNWVSHFSVKKSPEKGFGVQPKSPLGSPVKSSLPDVVRREILPDIFSNETCVSVREMVRKRENSVEFDSEIGVDFPTNTADLSQKLQVEVSETPHTNTNGDSNDLLKVQFPKELPKHVNDVGKKDSVDDISKPCDPFKVNFQLNRKEDSAAKVEKVFPKDINSKLNNDVVETNGVHHDYEQEISLKREVVTKTEVIEVTQVKEVQQEVTKAIPPPQQYIPKNVVEKKAGDVLDFAEPKPKIEIITDVNQTEVIKNIVEPKPEIVKNFVELNTEVFKSVVDSKSESKGEVEIPEFKQKPIFPPQLQKRKEIIPEPKKEVVKNEVKVEELLRSDLDEVNELIESLSEVNEIVESEYKIEKVLSEGDKKYEEDPEVYPMPPERRDSLKDSQQVSYASIQIKPKVEEENSESTSESISNNSFASSQVTIIENVGEFKGSEEIEVQLKVNGFDRIRTAEFVDVSGGLTLDESFTGLTESSTDDPDHFMSSSAFMVESGKEVYFEAGVHYLDDGHYWVEVPGLPNSDEDDDYFDSKIIKKAPMRVRFSVEPMKVYTTHSVDDYDRRNEDVDPVAASAEYELEKRVEKMEVFSVELMKGPEGLGLSIIGMGVGADAGLEKLGIFVKTITEGGAAHRDNRIQVNDQIIEVDGKSLVGVTQAYAASVLRNTSGLVKFLVGREKDPENSEVAQLIRQSLQADREREERRKLLEQPRGPPPPPPPPIHDPEVPTLKEKLKEKEDKLKDTENEIEILKKKMDDLQLNLKEKENVEVKVREMEVQLEEGRERLRITMEEVEELRKIVSQQTDMSELEKKYERIKKIVRLLQMREKDLFSRQEVQLIKIHERDGQYHDLLRSLKQRVNLLENELSEVTRRAGLPPHYLPPFPSIPPVPLPFSLPPPLPPIEIDLSDEENSVKEEFDSIPQHNLLDSSAGKAKADLASRGGLAGRQAPTVNKRPSSRSSNCSLDQEEIKAPSPELLRSVDTAHQYTHRYTPNFRTPPISPAKSYTSGNSPQIEDRLFSAYKAPSYPNPHFHTTTTPCFDYSISSHESSNHSLSSSSVVYTNQSISSMSNPTSPISVIPLNVAIQMNNSNSSAIMTSIKEKSSRDEESFDSWQSRESESNSSSAVSTVETFPVPVPEKWMNLSPLDWSNEQVCQWLLFLNLEHLIPPFMDHSITGPRLLQLESKELKSFGVNGDDKLKIKKKIKEMKLRVDKEKKQMEKDRKEREKLMKREKKKK